MNIFHQRTAYYYCEGFRTFHCCRTYRRLCVVYEKQDTRVLSQAINRAMLQSVRISN